MNYKKLTFLLVAILCFLFVSTSTFADNKKSGDLKYEKISGGAIITYCSPSAKGEIKIPSEINGNKVVEIAAGAFSGCTKIEKVVIPDSVTKIGKEAFKGCEWLEKVIIPDSVVEIGESAFNKCKKLQLLTIPNSLEKIGKEAFKECNTLENVFITGCNTEYNESTFNTSSSYDKDNEIFEKCKNLETVIVSDKCKIGEDAFNKCMKLQSVVIVDSSSKIHDEVFIDCKKLERLMIVDCNTEFCDNAFDKCDHMVYFGPENYLENSGIESEPDDSANKNDAQTGEGFVEENMTETTHDTTTKVNKDTEIPDGYFEVIKYNGTNYQYGIMNFKSHTAVNTVTEDNTVYTYDVLDENSFKADNEKECLAIDKEKAITLFNKCLLCLNDCKTEYGEIGFSLSNYGRIDSSAKRMVVAPSVRKLLDVTAIPGYDTHIDSDVTPWLCIADHNGHVKEAYLVIK